MIFPSGFTFINLRIISVNCSKFPGVAIVSGFGGSFAGSLQGFFIGRLCAAKNKYSAVFHRGWKQVALPLLG